jgi:hypothetical protein
MLPMVIAVRQIVIADLYVNCGHGEIMCSLVYEGEHCFFSWICFNLVRQMCWQLGRILVILCTLSQQQC